MYLYYLLGTGSVSLPQAGVFWCFLLSSVLSLDSVGNQTLSRWHTAISGWSPVLDRFVAWVVVFRVHSPGFLICFVLDLLVFFFSPEVASPYREWFSVFVDSLSFTRCLTCCCLFFVHRCTPRWSALRVVLCVQLVFGNKLTFFDTAGLRLCVLCIWVQSPILTLSTYWWLQIIIK